MAQSLSNLLVHVIFFNYSAEKWNSTSKRSRRIIADFQSEFRKLLDAHGVAYDERYVRE